MSDCLAKPIKFDEIELMVRKWQSNSKKTFDVQTLDSSIDVIMFDSFLKLELSAPGVLVNHLSTMKSSIDRLLVDLELAILEGNSFEKDRILTVLVRLAQGIGASYFVKHVVSLQGNAQIIRTDDGQALVRIFAQFKSDLEFLMQSNIKKSG